MVCYNDKWHSAHTFTEQAECFVNNRRNGFWNHAAASMGGGQYRIINNARDCIGPRLALFRDQPPQLPWSVVVVVLTTIPWSATSEIEPSPPPHPHPHPRLHLHPSTLTLTLERNPEPSSNCNVTLPTPRTHTPASTRPAVPQHWTTDDGYMRLCIAKGTLVPAKGRLVPARPAEP